MTKLYDVFLPLVQDLDNYGGNFTAHHIRRFVLDTIDAGAVNDPSLAALRDKLLAKMGRWKGLQDHKTFSALFEAYYEAVFYLVAARRSVSLRTVPAGADFLTISKPAIGFEVKTIDVADPKRAYDESMSQGLDVKVEAEALARKTGIGWVERFIRPHGHAKDRREAVEQVMKKIDGNVKADQFNVAPTFLVRRTQCTASRRRKPAQVVTLPW
jgi:hypothetical protein